MTEQELQSVKNRYGIIGNTSGINHALNIAAQVANTDLTVLIQGESGVGKEVFSQIIHNQSSRKHNSFIAINCGAIPEGTIDSELFGHEKGSFTSAVDARKGYFETANGGTIFLDEIGEMPIGTQARLLRVLETGEFIRVGSSKVQKTNVRVIGATNRDLLQQVNIGKFREDLYYRLCTIPIRVPALRERSEDVYQLFRKFCVDFSEKYRSQPVQLSEDAKHILMNYSWPGNVRQLKNIAEQVSVLSASKTLTGAELAIYLPKTKHQDLAPMLTNPENNSEFNSERDILYKLFFDMKKDVTDLKKAFFEIAKNGSANQVYNEQSNPEQILAHYPQEKWNNTNLNSGNNNIIISNENVHTPHQEVEEILNIAEKEKELIIKSLVKHKNKRRDAAKELGISERTLYRKIKEYDIEE